MTDSKLPSGIDRVVGQRIRWRRRELKLTQERLGELLELTFQQVQKYEKGVNRVSAGRLYEIAGVLGVPINYFFEGAEEFLEAEHAEFAEDDEEPHAPVMTPETLELISAPGFFEQLGQKTADLCASLESAAREAGVAVTTNQVGGMFGLFFREEKVGSYADAVACDVEAFKRFFHAMLDEGIYMAPSAFEAGFVSAAHSADDLAATRLAALASFKR